MIEIKNKRDYSGSGVYVGRPSPLGNPFPMLNEGMRDEVCDKYQAWLRAEYKKNGAVKAELERLARMYKAQGRLVLVCWCAPKRCHAQSIKKAILGICASWER
jgi:hypothetical protein